MSDEDNDVVTLGDVVKEKLLKDEEIVAVVGACDENECSYKNGYMERQALFSCITCDPLHERLAGVCYACSINCHNDHEMIELYTKRNFKCDCGNKKFGDFKCHLLEEKDSENDNNKYNHNFNGKYCTCKRPYPDPEDEIEDEMIQCIMCEDWYHSRHLGQLAPSEYSEMVCDTCSKNNVFLQYYKEYAVCSPGTTSKKPEKQAEDGVDVISTTAPIELTKVCTLSKLKSITSDPVKNEDLKAMFFENEWRNKLCKCEMCLAMYSIQGIEFIVKDSDTVLHHERKGKENEERKWEEAGSSLSQMGHVQQIEFVQGFNELKSGLTDFLNGFTSGEVVRKEHVDTFFEELNNKKRRRLETGKGVPPSNCK